jgi:hypothetical protein
MNRLRTLIVAALVGVTTSALAQETGTLIPRSAAQIDQRGPNAARLTMRAFAQCVASRSRGRLAKLLSLPVGSPEYIGLSRSIFDREGDECLSGGELSFSTTILRGAFFEAAYLQEFGRDITTDFSAVKDSGYRARYAEPYSPAERAAMALEQYGECIARANPRASRILIGTNPSTASESQIFTELAPSFGPCLTKGSEISFSKTVLRGLIAEGLYWLSTGQRAGQGVSK